MAGPKIKDVFMDFAFPIAILLMSTFILSIMDADLLLARRFFSAVEGWPWKNARPWVDLYNYGNIPPLILALCGLILFVLSFFIAMDVRTVQKPNLLLIK